MRLKGVERERLRLKRRYGMQVHGAGMKRIQLALLEKAAHIQDKPKPASRTRRKR